jgi:hypothetical protein
MPETTTVRISKKTKVKLEKVASLTGMNLTKTLDFALDVTEDKIDHYRGNIDSLLKIKSLRSGFSKTSEMVDKLLARAPTER